MWGLMSTVHGPTVLGPVYKTRGGSRIFERGGGVVQIRSTSKKGGPDGGPI